MWFIATSAMSVLATDICPYCGQIPVDFACMDRISEIVNCPYQECDGVFVYSYNGYICSNGHTYGYLGTHVCYTQGHVCSWYANVKSCPY